MGIIFLLLSIIQIFHHARPVREPVCAELDVMVAKLGGTMGGAVIDEVGTRLETEVLLMGEDDALMERLREVPFDPIELVLQGCGIIPWGSREDVAVVFFCQRVYGINGTRHGFH